MIFLVINGLILLAGERARRRIETPQSTVRQAAPLAPIAGDSPELDLEGSLRTSHRGARSTDELAEAYASDQRLAQLSYRKGLYIGSCQILALLAGISRSGVTIVGGLLGGLDHALHSVLNLPNQTHECPRASFNAICGWFRGSPAKPTPNTP